MYVVSDSRTLTTATFTSLQEAVEAACNLSLRHSAGEWDWADHPDEYSVWGGEAAPTIYEVEEATDVERIGGTHREYRASAGRQVPVEVIDWLEEEDPEA